MLLIENSQQQRQTGASTDKVATEINRFREDMKKQNAALAEASKYLLTGPDGAGEGE